MDRGLEDFIDRTAAAASIDEVGTLLRGALEAEGFENLVFASTRHGALREIVWATLPEGYAETYVAERWDRVDPVLRHALGRAGAFAWEDVTRAGGLTPGQRAFMGDSAALGVRAGLTAPLHGPSGDVDLVSVSMRTADAAPRMRLRHVHALCLQAWLARAELTPTPTPPTPEISGRELECLKWLRDGKSNWEIGQILSISEKTVEFHVGNLLRKLHAESRLAAVMLALKAGLIEL